MNQLPAASRPRALCALPVTMVAVLALSGCMGVQIDHLFEPPLAENTIQSSGLWADGKVVVVDIGGTINLREGGLLAGARTTPGGVSQVLAHASRDDAVKAIVLRIDSPGGGVAATDAIHQQLVRFKAEHAIPVYACIRSVGCSGAYYIATAADRIYAHPTAVVGSIGVIARFPQVQGLARKIGYDEVILTTGSHKAMGHPLRELPEDERRMLQAIIDHMFEQFLQAVAAGRPRFDAAQQVRPVADGSVYTAARAQKLGLVDEIAYLPDVIEAVCRRAGLARPRIVRYLPGKNPDATVQSRLPTDVNLLKVELGKLPARDPGFYYLWWPLTPAGTAP